MAYVTNGYIEFNTIDRSESNYWSRFYRDTFSSDYPLFFVPIYGYAGDNTALYLLYTTKDGVGTVAVNRKTDFYQYLDHDRLIGSNDTVVRARETSSTDSPHSQMIYGYYNTDYHNFSFGLPPTCTIPIFDTIDDAQDYIANGDTSKAVNADEFIGDDLEIHVYINGTDRPNVTFAVNWESAPNREVLCYVSLEDSTSFVNQFTALQDGESYATTYDSLVATVDPKWYQELINNIFGGKLCVNFATADIRGYVIIPKKGIPTEYTISKGQIFIHYNEDNPNDDNYTPVDENGDIIDNETNIASATNVLTHTYVVSSQTLANVGNKLWDKSFFDDIFTVNNNPIENIVSCKAFPFSVPQSSSKEIVIGNVDFNIQSNLISNRIYEFTIGTFSIPMKYGSFLDYPPYTNVSAFLPYIGYVTLDANKLIGKTCTLKYCVDLLTGACKAILNNGVSNVASYDGHCSTDVPLTASNSSQVESARIGSIVGSLTNASLGNISGTIDGIAGAISPPFHSTTKGGIDSLTMACEGVNCYLIVDRPKVQYPDNYNKIKGRPCYLKKTLKNLKGFTICDENTRLGHLNNCTEQEREMIKEFLTSGIIL